MENKQLIECVPNFSEGRDMAVIAKITDEIQKVEGVKLLNVDPGKATNRTVVTFVGEPEAVIDAAFQAIKKASEVIDMSKHSGEHPRMGATDVCPLIPIANISMEETKSGINPQMAKTLVREIASMHNLSLEGLMTMPPYFDDPQKARPYFTALRELRDTLLGEHIETISLQELSIGMSGDFEVAIEEGATMVRIGTAIFGERPPKT